MRVSELCEARRHQLVLQGDTWGIEVVGKGGHQRWVPLSRSAVSALEGYLRVSLDRFADDELEDVIFVGRSNGPISANWVREVARAVAEEINVECSPHVLRHTWATRAHRAGVPATDIQAVLGHVSPATTAIYIHADADSMARAVELADRLE
jgi:site-specific recombinase XerD